MLFEYLPYKTVQLVQEDKNGERPDAHKIGPQELLARIWARLVLFCAKRPIIHQQTVSNVFVGLIPR